MISVSRPVLTILLASVLTGFAPTLFAKDESLKVWPEKIDGGYRLYARTADDFPRSLQVSLTSLKNLRSTATLPFQTVVTNGSAGVHLFDLQIVNRTGRDKFNFEYEFVSGNFESARHDESHVYVLPFQHGTKHLLSQGYHGKFSHSEPGREYAIDFTMPENTGIIAARAGTVVTVRTDSNRGGSNKSFEDDGNYITILHNDGSLAEYVHLIRGGAFVRPGQIVEAGDKIGLSGNTGRSTGPHLHFHVGVPTASGKLRTLPTRFLSAQKEAISPTQGQIYYAYHPGKPAFSAPASRAADLTNLESHRTEIPRENKISTRAETIDGAVVVFLRNGYTEAKEILLTLPTMENLNPSKTVPLSIVVEPQTERFAVLLKQRDFTIPFRYETAWKYRSAN